MICIGYTDRREATVDIKTFATRIKNVRNAFLWPN